MAQTLSWLPDLSKREGPLYQALADQLANDIASGRLEVGTRLPPQRALAWELGCTHGTVTRAYERAEKMGLVQGEIGRGTYVKGHETLPSPLSPPANQGAELDFARNFSLPHLDPDLSAALGYLSSQSGLNSLLNYVPADGLLRHKEAGAFFFRHFAVTCSVEDVLVTSGAQHGLQVVLQSLFREGDYLAVDELSYPNLISASHRLGVRLVPVRRDCEGMSADHLQDLCKRRSITGLMVLPNVHNPTGEQLSRSRFEALADIAERFDLPVIEDDPYSALMQGHKQSLTQLIPNRVCAIGTTSKIVGGGLRTGFLYAPSRYRAKLVRAIADTSWMASPILAEIAKYWIEQGEMERTLERKRKILQQRHKIAKQALGQAAFLLPDRLSCWLELPDHWNPAVLELEAERHGISLLGSHHFVVGNSQAPKAVRLALGTVADDEKFSKGLKLLSTIIQHNPE
ncbi:PLP-dependent aminotransferase family protein [Cohaesibacter gelatinilyticus]|uniref:DNA-binding transcriptional regulator, MocR family, contains an aminotransferase domain n=1 Tax=Cohaesibacter gelatinilyticus TaxID=372072 RepID=A0A285NCL0_9HYPH|nr:PLP-dependent aminotransferase family protein [Cohaesibacter gelatinilyticus]SNZ05676.1 DNA-binding transcriptional regulator, MocR family, contains an aminotransferase domain [Cohaesibacter gelatinilyticus]